MAVDDVQWLDEASASVLGFALRRLAAAPAAILIARRSDGSEPVPLGLERAFPEERLWRLPLGPLSVGATHRLLRERLGVSFRRHTLVQLHQRSGGNPFYALEFARALEQSGDLAIPASLSGLVSARLAALPEDVREALEPIALLSEPTISIVEAVASDPTTVLERLREAQAVGILELDDDERVRFSHPLLAAQVESELEPRRRRLLHRRLAKLVGDVEQRARHLALGADRPSTRVADELETASAVAASRGATGAAAELAELSLSLTPTSAPDGVLLRRQLLAADQHYASGDVERLRAILEPLVEQLPPGVERARVLRRLGETSFDDFERSERLLEQAFIEAETDARLKAEIVGPRVTTAFLRHGPAAAVKLARELGSGRGGQRRSRPACHVPGGAQPRGALWGRFDTGSARARARARAVGRALADAYHADARRRTASAVRGRARGGRRGLGTGIRRGGSQRRRVGAGQCLALSDRAGVPCRRLGTRRRACGGNAPVRERLGSRVPGRIVSLDPWPGRRVSRPSRRGKGACDRGCRALPGGRRASVPRAESRAARSDRPIDRRLRGGGGNACSGRPPAAGTWRGRAEPLSGPRACDRGAGRGRRPGRGPGPARMAGRSRLPARDSLAACAWAGAAVVSSRQPREIWRRRSQAASERWRCTSGCRRPSSVPARC